MRYMYQKNKKKSYNFLEKLDVEWENLDAAVELQWIDRAGQNPCQGCVKVTEETHSVQET